jgi:hypothetical protein
LFRREAYRDHLGRVAGVEARASSRFHPMTSMLYAGVASCARR